MNIYHTTLANTAVIHIGISEDLDIVPLIHSLHIHFSCIRGSPHTQYPQIRLQYLTCRGMNQGRQNYHISSFMCIDDEAGEKILQVNGQRGCVFFSYVASLGLYIFAHPTIWLSAQFFLKIPLPDTTPID